MAAGVGLKEPSGKEPPSTSCSRPANSRTVLLPARRGGRTRPSVAGWGPGTAGWRPSPARSLYGMAIGRTLPHAVAGRRFRAVRVLRAISLAFLLIGLLFMVIFAYGLWHG